MSSADRPTDSGIDVAATLLLLLRRWPLIIGCIITALIAAVVYLHAATYRYAVTMRVAPPASSAGDGVSSRLSQLGGLAAVAGVSLPDSGGSASFKLFVEALHSRDVAEALARDPAIMHGIFRQEWDARTRTWRLPSGFIYGLSKSVKPVLGIPSRAFAPPGPARLKQWLVDNIGVDQNLKTPVVTVTLMSEDPALAIYVLKQLDSTIDTMLRERALLRADEYIRYLAARLPTIALAEQRIAIAQALGEQERLKMAAGSNRAFAAEVFEHPAATDRPVLPVPSKVLAMALLLGLVVGVGLALVIPRRRPAFVAEP
jgi:LPS O-antigen subunit length determinant protein (WzzB/FepE family)